MSDWKQRAVKIDRNDWRQRASKIPSTNEQGSNISQNEAAFRGASQGALWGLPDEFKAYGQAASDWIKNDPNGFWKNYRHYRGIEHQKNEEAEREYPITYGASLMGGAVLPALLTGGGSLPMSAAKMFAHGAAQGFGSSKADLTKGEIAPAALDTALGGTAGVVVGKGLQLAGKGLKNLTNKELLTDFAHRRAVKAVTGTNIGAIRKITGSSAKNPSSIQKSRENLRRTGKDLAEEPDVMKFYSKSEEMAPRIEAAKSKYGKNIGDIVNQVDEIVPDSVNAKNIARKIEEFASSIPDTPRGQRLKEALQKEINTYDKIGRFSFKKAHDYKQDYKFTVGDSDALISNSDALTKIKEIISKEMEDTIERMSVKKPFELTQLQVGPKGKHVEVPPQYREQFEGLADQYRHNKSKYRSFKNLNNAAIYNEEMGLNRRLISPSDYAAGLATGAVTSIPGGIKAALANKLLRERGSAFAAKGILTGLKVGSTISDNLSQVLKTDPQKLGKFAQPLLSAAQRGPQALAAANFILQQTQPEYRKLVLEPIGEANDEEHEFVK